MVTPARIRFLAGVFIKNPCKRVIFMIGYHLYRINARKRSSNIRESYREPPVGARRRRNECELASEQLCRICGKRCRQRRKPTVREGSELLRNNFAIWLVWFSVCVVVVGRHSPLWLPSPPGTRKPILRPICKFISAQFLTSARFRARTRVVTRRQSLRLLMGRRLLYF